MKFDEYLEKLEQLVKLIEQSNTGTPTELAKRLNVSERTLRRLISKLKTKDNVIVYNRRINSYTVKNK